MKEHLPADAYPGQKVFGLRKAYHHIYIDVIVDYIDGEGDMALRVKMYFLV